MAVGYFDGHFDGHIGFYDDQGTCKCSLLLHLFNRSRKHVRRQKNITFLSTTLGNLCSNTVTPSLHKNSDFSRFLFSPKISPLDLANIINQSYCRL